MARLISCCIRSNSDDVRAWPQAPRLFRPTRREIATCSPQKSFAQSLNCAPQPFATLVTHVWQSGLTEPQVAQMLSPQAAPQTGPQTHAVRSS